MMDQNIQPITKMILTTKTLTTMRSRDLQGKEEEEGDLETGSLKETRTSWVDNSHVNRLTLGQVSGDVRKVVNVVVVNIVLPGRGSVWLPAAAVTWVLPVQFIQDIIQGLKCFDISTNYKIYKCFISDSNAYKASVFHPLIFGRMPFHLADLTKSSMEQK